MKKYFYTLIIILLIPTSVLFSQLTIGSPTFVSDKYNIMPYHSAWMQDPLQTTGPGKVWIMKNYFGDNVLVEYTSLVGLQSNSISKTYSLPTAHAGTGAVVYGGFLYYSAAGSSTMVKYDLNSESVVATSVLPNAGSMNTYPYNWGGYSDIDFAIDENGLWVLYSTLSNSGKLVVSKLNPANLSIIQTWNTNSLPKTWSGSNNDMTDAFVIDGIVYCINGGFAQQTNIVYYRYDTYSSTGSTISITITFPRSPSNNTTYVTQVSYNPLNKLLYVWNSASLYTYQTNGTGIGTITNVFQNTSICQGATVNLPYTVTGTYNAGNIFTVQLSDASGSFASPTNIGSISATTSGTISATIPNNTPAGSGYRIRVVSSNPVVTGNDNGSNITISQPPVVTAVASNNATGPVLPKTMTFGAGNDVFFAGQGPGAKLNGGRTNIYSAINTSSYGGLWWTFTPIENPRHSSQGGSTGQMVFNNYNAATGIITFTSTANMVWPGVNGTENIATRVRMQLQPYTGSHSGPIGSGWITPVTADGISLASLAAGYPLIDIKAIGATAAYQVWYIVETAGGIPLDDYYNNPLHNSTVGGSTQTSLTGSFFSSTLSTCNGGPATVTVTATGGTGPYIGTGVFSATIGEHTYTVTDANGCSGSATIDVEGQNCIELLCVENKIVTTEAGSCVATVMNIDPNITPSNAIVNYKIEKGGIELETGVGSVSGKTFAAGITTVTYTAADEPTKTCSFTVTVNDEQAPTVVQPDNISVVNAVDQCSASINFSTNADDNCTVTSLKYYLYYSTPNQEEISFPKTFAIGSYVVTVVAKDAANNTTTKTFTITVIDNQPPSITCPAPVTINASPGLCTGTTTLAPPTVTDNCNSFGNALSFGGGYVNVPNAAILNPFNEWTLETWVKRTNTGVQESLIEKYIEPGNTYGYLLRILDNNKAMAGFVFGSFAGYFITGTTTILPNTWYHLAATFNRTTGVMKLYVNGVLDAQVSGMAGLATIPNTASLKLGARGDDAATRLSNGGLMDEIRVWSVERTQAQIQLSMNSELGAQPGLVALYHLNQGIAGGNNLGITTATDASGNNNNGSLVSFSLTGPTSNWVNGKGFGLTVTNDAPVTYPKGNTNVTWTATDASGNSAACTQVVTVVDNQPPSIICPEPVTIHTTQGLCTGTTTLTPPIVTDNCNALGNALNFNGGYVNVPHSSLITPLSAWTIETWVRRTTTNTQESLIEKYSNAYGVYGYLLRIQGDYAVTSFLISSNFGYTITGTTPLLPNVWYHLAATFNRTSGEIKLYVNGVLDGQLTGLSGLPTDPGTQSLKIGARGDDADTRLSNGGLMDEVRIWNVERTQAEILSSMNYELGAQPGLVALYHLNQGIAGGNNTGLTNVIDASGNGHNGSLIDFALTGPTSNWVGGKDFGLNLHNNAPDNFPTGNTIVTWTATDASGNSAACTQVVTVEDNQQPVITSPVTGNTNRNTNPGLCTYKAVLNEFNATATDNCGVTSLSYQLTGATTGTGTTLTDVVFNKGVTTVKWTASDGVTGTVTSSFTVTVADNQQPIITCPVTGNTNRNTNPGVCTYKAVLTEFNATATDNCAVTSLTYALTGATTGTGTTLADVIFNKGVTTVAWIASDGVNATVRCSFTVTVIDNQQPIVTCPVTGNTNRNTNAGVCTYTAAPTEFNATATDNCTIASLTYELTGVTSGTGTTLAGVVFNKGATIVTWTASDGVTTNVTCSFTVTVIDNEKPTFTCPSNQNVNLNGTCQLVVPNLIAELTGNDNCGTVTFTQSPLAGASFASSHNQTHNVVITASDGNGNIQTCTVVLTGKDVTKPTFTCPDNQNVNLNGTCQLIVPNLVSGLTGNDNCGTVTFTQSPVAGASLASSHNQTHNVLITASDGNGNTQTCAVVVTGKDVTPPTFTSCPTNITMSATTGQCGRVINFTVTAADNCSGSTSANVSSLTGDILNTDFNNATSGLFTPAITASKLTFTTNGYAHSHGGTLNVYVDIHNPNTNAWTQVFVQQLTSGSQFSFSGLQIDFASQVVDQVRLRSSIGQDQTFHNWGSTIFTLNNTGLTIVSSHSSGFSFPVGTTTVTNIATDEAGNTSTCSFTVTVTDNEKPTVTAPTTVDLECSSNLPSPATTITQFLALPGSEAHDNCTGQAALLVSSSDGPLVNGNCNGTITRKYTITDGAGNATTVNHVFTVTDNTKPTATAPTTVDLECRSDLPAGKTTIAGFLSLTGANANDNCTPQADLQVSFVDGPLVSGNCNGTITRTYTITDACSNTITVTHVFTVTDNTKPTTTAPATVDLECSSDLPAGKTTIAGFLSLTGANANDNCTPQVDLQVSFVDGPLVNGNCNGSITRTYTITDGCGNATTVNHVFTVTDNIRPTATCPTTVDLECSGDLPPAKTTIAAFLSLVGANANDNCTPQANLLVSSVDGPLVGSNCNGTITRTYTVTDACGNTTTVTHVFTVTDNTIPVINTCPGNGVTFIRNTNAGACTYQVAGTEFNATASDNCTGVTMSYSIVNEHNPGTVTGTGSLAGKYLKFGLNTITWIATDGCGNTSVACAVKVDVDKITTTTSLTVNPASQQYSDLVTFTATATPNNCTGAGDIGGTVTFKIGSVIIGTAPLTNGVATVTDTLIEDMLYDANLNDPMNPTNGPLKPGAKTVTAYFNGTDADYIVTDPTAPLTVTCENADITYNGQTYFSVSPTTNAGTVVLSNYVVDKNDTPTGARGDIRNATATFWQNSINGSVLGTANIPVGLVNPTNKQEGFVTTSFNDVLSTTDISNGGKVYEVWSGLNNYYCENSDTYTPVTLGLPGQDFVTGGGYIVFGNNSAGTYAGTQDKRMNFGFVMKWNSSGKNLQGRVNVVYRKMVNGVQRIYQIKSNAINSLVVENVNDAGSPATGTNIKFRRATISTKANLADITDPLNPISLGGNLNLTLIAWESTTVTTGALDRINVQLSGTGSIGLLFSSNWVSGNTTWQTLNGGKIQVRNPSTPAPGQRTTTSEEIIITKTTRLQLFIKAFPNPSDNYFNLMVEGSRKEDVVVSVYNVNGVRIHQVKGTANRYYKFGEGWIPGTYLVEVRQGNELKTVKLVKQ